MFAAVSAICTGKMRLQKDFLHPYRAYLSHQKKRRVRARSLGLGLARKLVVPGVVDYLSLAEGVLVRELEVKDWAGKTLRELNLTNTYELQVVAIKPLRRKHFYFVPKADLTLQAGDVLLILGEEEKLSQIMA
jgi:Trk K+ transport system NAD-binding subunit